MKIKMESMFPSVISAAILASVAVAGTLPVQATTYNFTALGSLTSGSGSYAFGINDSGTVVGQAVNSSDQLHAFIYTSSGGMQDLGTLGGPNSAALGINNSGTVVGEATAANGVFAFSYTSSGGMSNLGDLGVPLYGGTYSRGSAINDLGTIVGYSVNSAGYTRATVYTSASGLQVIGTLPGGNNSYAYAINGSGTVVGNSDTATIRTEHAFSYSNGTMTDLGTLGGTYSVANAINTGGTIVGSSYLLNGYSGHAFSYSNGMMSDLGVLPGGSVSTANGISDSGIVVGMSDVSSGAYHAFVDSNGAMSDLNNLTVNLPNTFLLKDAYAINSFGDIVGVGYNNSWPQHNEAFLLTPTPEPGALAMLGIAGAGMLLLGRRRGVVRAAWRE